MQQAWISSRCVGLRTVEGDGNLFNVFMSEALPLYPLPYATLPADMAVQRSQVPPWWSGPSTQEHHHVLLGAVGVVLIVGMLLVFVQVLSGAMEQGAARRAATAAQLASIAACTAMQGHSAQHACRVQVAAANASTNVKDLRD